jgi:phage/plasmid-like protein (TIGR03299 family)
MEGKDRSFKTKWKRGGIMPNPQIKIGEDISRATSIEEAISMAGLDWKVEKNETYASRGFPWSSEDGSMSLWKSPKFVSIMRSDTGEEFAHPTQRYEVVQNLDSFRWVEDIVGGGEAEYWRAGSFRGGRKVFMIVKLPIPLTMGNGETIARAMIISTSHDSTAGLKANWLPFRFACANVISASLASAPMVLRHTSSAQTRISPETARGIFYNAELFYDSFYKEVNALVASSYSDGDMEDLIETIFTAPRAEPQLRIRRSNDYLYERIIQNFRNGRETYGSNRWDAYNAVCEYLDYQRPLGNTLATAGGEDPEIMNERQFNSILSNSRYGGNKVRTKTLQILREGM